MGKNIKVVTLIGTGTMGPRIAARAAVHGQIVRMYDISAEALDAAKESTKSFIDSFSEEGYEKEDTATIFERVSFYTDLAEALQGVDLIVEAVPENLELKKKVFAEFDKLADKDTIIATNSSSIPISRIEGAVERKNKVLNLHFYTTPFGVYAFADIMRGTQTDDETFEAGRDWLEDIGCIPLEVKKECMGFVFNRVWRAIKKDTLKIWGGGYADFQDVDRAWMLFSGMPVGPFGAMDMVGLDVVYDIEMSYYSESQNPDDIPPDALKEKIAKGELGMKTGKGFYDWSDPECFKPDFTKPKKKK